MHIDIATRAFNDTHDTQHGDLRRELVRAAVNYAHLRAEWFLAAPEPRMDMDRRRTAAHNTFIDPCNILRRQMAKTGESTKWRELLGTDRKEIGDFACFVALFVELAAR